MLLEKVIEIIELTDTDTLCDALAAFNKSGIVSNLALPYLDIIFDSAPTQLCSKLQQIGFQGMVEIATIKNNSIGRCYAVYDAIRYSNSDAQSWLESEFSAA